MAHSDITLNMMLDQAIADCRYVEVGHRGCVRRVLDYRSEDRANRTE
jgi:hypothetical protein